MLSDSSYNYTWNAESEMKSAAGVNYTYDGDGDRLEKSTGKIYWYGAGTEILDESDLSGNFTNEYVFFGGKRIAMRNVIERNDLLSTPKTCWAARGRWCRPAQTSVCYDADFYPFGGERDVTATLHAELQIRG